MGFNKAREEKKWRKWKEVEEKKLRKMDYHHDCCNAVSDNCKCDNNDNPLVFGMTR